jgi:hypothetical protein
MSEGRPHGLLMALMEPDRSREEEFNDWYDTEHIPQMSAVTGFLTATRWVCVEGWPRYLATYDLESIDVLSSDSYRQATGGNFTPWARRILGGGVRGWRRIALAGLDSEARVVNARTIAIDVMFLDIGAGADGLTSGLAARPGVLQARGFDVPDEGLAAVVVEAGALADLPPLPPPDERPLLRGSARYVRYTRRDPLHAFHAIDAGEAH